VEVTHSRTDAITVTHTDVLFVSSQITKDLRALRAHYPDVISEERLNSLTDAVAIFLINRMAEMIGYALVEPTRHRLIQELLYRVTYDGAGPRVGTGGSNIKKVDLPPGTELVPWVDWTKTFRDQPVAEQRRLLQGTGWNLPGAADPKLAGIVREGGRERERATYAAGALSVNAREYR
jgi:hypothetical protein